MTLHVTPTTLQLVEAVREFLQNEVMQATDGQLSFHARVAANVLRTVERELAGEAEDDAWAMEQLRSVGVSSEEELADLVKSAPSLASLASVVDVLQALTRARLQASNPAYLVDVSDDDPTAP